MDFSEIDKVLAVIKPAEQRIVGWGAVLPPIFNWEESNLRELKNYDVDGAMDLNKMILKTPTKDDLPKLKDLDTAITFLTKKSKELEKERKELTEGITNLGKRLMIPEKTYSALAESLKPSFLNLKRIENEEKDKIARRSQEVTNFKTKCQTYFNQQQSIRQTYIQAKVTDSYREALENIEVEDAQDYVDNLVFQHGSSSFSLLNPAFSPSESADAEMMDVWNSIKSHWDGEKLAVYFDTLLTQTFSDFANAKPQKEVAIEQREAEQIVEIQEIKEMQEMADTLAVIDAKAAPVESVAMFEKTREIKKSYKIKMDHNQANMRIINKAFYQNMQECLSIWQGKDCWSISTVDQGELLCKLRNKDNAFQPDGVIFDVFEKI